MRKRFFAAFLTFLILFARPIFSDDSQRMLIILQAGREANEGMARAMHALLYAQELKEHGHDVVLMFDGAGTQWVNEWMNPESQDRLRSRYLALSQSGIPQVVCDFCATAFDARRFLDGNRVPMARDYEGHPSIAKFVDEGYQIVIL